MNVVLLVLDGIGDRPWPVLNAMTPLEAAETPSLDSIAAQSATGILHTLGPGRAPGSELAHWTLFGYPLERYPGRAVFEAAAAGVALEPSQVALHATTVMVEQAEDGSLPIVERSVPIGSEMAAELAGDLSEYEYGGITIRPNIISDSDFLITLSGQASTDVTDSDPHNLGWPVAQILPLEDVEDPDAASNTATALNAWLDELWDRMSRLAEPGGPIPFCVLKWPGRNLATPSFESITGMRGHIVSAGGVFEGMASVLGMDHSLVPSTTDKAADLSALIAAGAAALDQGADFVHIHDKEPDNAGHTKSPELKRDVIAELDRALAEVASGALFGDGTVLIVTGDHGTPAGTDLIHSGDPVPIAIRASAVAPDDVPAFSERACVAGSLGHLRGEDIMPLALNARGTTRYLSGRLSPHTGHHWPAPGQYESYRIPESRSGS
jgi:2,3-bisphosphoglycerate-independent phosphoglycerate mutase